ncbi:MAG: hypothetical protein MUO89_07310 [Dehalococcoidia bacterium]|nr:hypothetical protein [Dehalococcoidia bacterium]
MSNYTLTAVIELLKTYDIFNDIFLPAAGLSHGYQRMLGIAMASQASNFAPLLGRSILSQPPRLQAALSL